MAKINRYRATQTNLRMVIKGSIETQCVYEAGS